MSEQIDLDKLRAMRPFWYLATPYTLYPHGLEQAYHDGAMASGFLHDRHVRHFYAIGHCHKAAEVWNLDPCDADYWQLRLRPFIDLAGGLLIVPMRQWYKSRGIKQEIKLFDAANKPVDFLPWPLPLGDT